MSKAEHIYLRTGRSSAEAGRVSHAWYEAYAAAYAALPDAAHVRCPNRGYDALRLVFTGLPEGRVGFASFWCDHCRYGLHLSRVAVPGGVDIVPLDLPTEAHDRLVPDYVLVGGGHG